MTGRTLADANQKEWRIERNRREGVGREAGGMPSAPPRVVITVTPVMKVPKACLSSIGSIAAMSSPDTRIRRLGTDFRAARQDP